MKKNVTPIGLFFLLFWGIFSGCTISDNSKQNPKVFIPGDTTKNEIPIGPEQKIQTPKKEKDDAPKGFTLFEEKENYSGMKKWKIYSKNNSDCIDKKGICIFEVWENGEKIFFFEEYEPGDFLKKYKSLPQKWITEDTIGFLEVQNREEFTRILLYSLDVYDGSFTYIWKGNTWEKKSPEDISTTMTVTFKGSIFFIDATSSSTEVSLYKVIDPKKQFFAKDGMTGNLSPLGQITVPENSIVDLIPSIDTIRFSASGKEYFYKKNAGIEQQK